MQPFVIAEALHVIVKFLTNLTLIYVFSYLR